MCRVVNSLFQVVLIRRFTEPRRSACRRELPKHQEQVEPAKTSILRKRQKKIYTLYFNKIQLIYQYLVISYEMLV